MRAAGAIGLVAVAGECVILEDVRVEARLNDLLAEVTVTQRYRNPESTNIEAIYTFPLPFGAVLLGLEAEIGEKKLTGTVVDKSESEHRYEDAIAEGNAAMLLEEAGEGLYTASLGNLLPGETATIRFYYGLLLCWNGDRVRFAIPTTIAPRYGDPGAAGFAPHQAPQYALDAERSFALRVAVKGLLKNARFDSPSHLLAITPGAKETVIEFAGSPAMDRDFILEARAPQPQGAGALLARDAEGWVALASFCPEILESSERARRSVTIVIDCSGSMAGDSIAQAKTALERILDRLETGDLFEIIAFGSDQRALFGRLAPVSEITLGKARGFVRALEADLGGTEIGAALEAAYGTRSAFKLPRDVLLITDGEVWNSSEVIARAKASGQRIFTVGVGSAVAEALLRGLAEATGGACELVSPLSPREDMAGRIHRHFQRLYAPRAQSAVVAWPQLPSRRIPDPIEAVYGGDTIHLFAWFADKPEGRIGLDLTLTDGQNLRLETDIVWFEEDSVDTPVPASTPAGALARLAAARRLRATEDEALGREIALHYQLLSRWTNCLVVHARADSEKAEDLPTIRRIPQVLAAGWHGTLALREDAGLHLRSHSFALRAAPTFAPREWEARIGTGAVIEHLNARPMPPLPTLADLAAAGLPSELEGALRDLVTGGEQENAVVLTLLYALLQSSNGRLLSRQVKRFIRKLFRDLTLPQALIDAVTVVSAGWLEFVVGPNTRTRRGSEPPSERKIG